MNPFDDLVLDEPPMRLTPDRVVELGRARVRRRRLVMAAGLVAVVAVAVPVALVDRDGQDRSNDYFLVNDNPAVRRYRIAPDAKVWGSITVTGSVELQAVPLERLLEFLREDPSGSNTLFHLQVEDGQVVATEGQYRP